ncbi:hypothetical protein Tco_1277440 [Tanacetum coccineum]
MTPATTAKRRGIVRGIVLLTFAELIKKNNFGVTCEDEAKRRNSGAKTKTFEENCHMLLYAVCSKEDTAYQRQLITRIRVMINSRFSVSLNHLYAVCTSWPSVKD